MSSVPSHIDDEVLADQILTAAGAAARVSAAEAVACGGLHDPPTGFSRLSRICLLRVAIVN